MGSVTIQVSELEKIINTEMDKILSIISKEYKLDKDSLLDKVKRDWSINLLDYSDVIKQRKSRPINPNNLCMARKPNLKRCTRIKKINCDYCASHQFNILYGRIDEEPKIMNTNNNTNNDINNDKSSKIIKNKSKKKSSSKSKNNQKNNQIKKKYKKSTIKLKSIMISEKEYFIDNNNHLYITEKDGEELKYRHIGNWEKKSQTINLKDNILSK